MPALFARIAPVVVRGLVTVAYVRLGLDLAGGTVRIGRKLKNRFLKK